MQFRFVSVTAGEHNYSIVNIWKSYEILRHIFKEKYIRRYFEKQKRTVTSAYSTLLFLSYRISITCSNHTRVPVNTGI